MTMRREFADASARALLRAALRDPAILAELPPGELDLALRLLRRARLLGRLGFALREQGGLDALPGAARDQLESALVVAAGRERVARWELDRLALALGGVPDIPIVLMKGCAYLLAALPNARGRVFADVDLLVPEQGLAAVEACLAAQGWRGTPVSPYDDRYYRRWTHELPPMTHVEREVEVDLHHNLLMRTARLKPDAGLLLAAAVVVPGSPFRTLDPIDMILHAMTHLLYGGELDDALRDLVDIDDLLRYFGGRDPGFWERFWPRAVQLDLARPAYYGLRYASQLLDTPVPQFVLEAARAAAPPAPVRAVMDRLMPDALFPRHPDRPRRAAAVARLLLYVRSHWVRMPPLLLIRHLGFKFWVRHVWRDAEPSPG